MYIILIVSIIICPKFAALERRVGETLHVANDVYLLPLQIHPLLKIHFVHITNYIYCLRLYNFIDLKNKN